jgi:hypothetical protein
MSLMHFLPVVSRPLARSVDVYRDSTFRLAETRPMGRLWLPNEALTYLNAVNEHGFGCAEISQLKYERTARLYSETANKLTKQKSNMFVIIVSIYITCNVVDHLDHGLMGHIL